MNTEQKLNIVEKTTAKGVYKNINLKDIEQGNYIIITKSDKEPKMFEKDFGQGMKKSYLIIANYQGEDVSFFLKDKNFQQFDNQGSAGDKVKVTAIENTFVNSKTKVKMLYNDLTFDLV
jgi:hypothetical protein